MPPTSSPRAEFEAVVAQYPSHVGTQTGWRASNCYWRKARRLVVLVCIVLPILSARVMPFALSMSISLAIAVPLVVWTRRLAAWDEGDVLVVRGWFRTTRIPWKDVELLSLAVRGGSTKWIVAAVRHGRTTTYLDSMVATSAAGAAELAEELRGLGRPHGIEVDDAVLLRNGLSIVGPRARP
jgi:hypothetical protein